MSLDIYLEYDCCPTCGRESKEGHWQNITHNLNVMAKEAGIYGILWHPKNNEIYKASQLIEPLRKAIAEMEADPDRFKKFDSPNGWGLYVHFVPWLKELLAACEQMPSANVRSST